MTAFTRTVGAIAIAFFAAQTLAAAEDATIVRVHGRILATPSRDTVVAAIEASAGAAAQTRRFRADAKSVHAGEEFEATLDTATNTLTSIVEMAPLATPPPAHLVTNGSAKSVVLDSIVFVLGVLILGGLLAWITKRVIIDERH